MGNIEAFIDQFQNKKNERTRKRNKRSKKRNKRNEKWEVKIKK